MAITIWPGGVPASRATRMSTSSVSWFSAFLFGGLDLASQGSMFFFTSKTFKWRRSPEDRINTIGILETDHHILQEFFQLDLCVCILPSLHRLELREFCRRNKSFFWASDLDFPAAFTFSFFSSYLSPSNSFMLWIIWPTEFVNLLSLSSFFSLKRNWQERFDFGGFSTLSSLTGT